jgi:hypothetical protein
MPDTSETGIKWWMRYVVVPVLGGGGIIAIAVAVIDRQPVSPQKKEANNSGNGEKKDPIPSQFLGRWEGPIENDKSFADPQGHVGGYWAIYTISADGKISIYDRDHASSQPNPVDVTGTYKAPVIVLTAESVSLPGGKRQQNIEFKNGDLYVRVFPISGERIVGSDAQHGTLTAR